MAYLVQTNFKNGYRDFRIGDCAFYEDFQTAKPKAYMGQKSYWIQKDSEDFEVLDEFRELGQAHNLDIKIEDEYPDSVEVVVYAGEIKTWPLADGQPLGKPATYLYFDGSWHTKEEFAQFYEKFMEEAGF